MRFASTALLFAGFLATSVSAQTVLQRIGYEELQARIGPSLEDGSGISVATVEAFVGGNYRVDTTDVTEFAGKSIVDGSPTVLVPGPSGHATNVARRQYGNVSSTSPGVTDVTNYEANDWLNRVLGGSSGPFFVNPPLPQRFEVVNHSYIASGDIARVRRLDYIVNRDDSTHVVGSSNDPDNLPVVFGHSYNAIVVGQSSGGHGQGPTSANGVGRTKPDIVAPESNSSNAAPRVSSAAALLRARGNTLGNLDANRNEVIKAALMAGATKEEFVSWDNSTVRPLDEVFGAGELNVDNSYRIISGGEFDGSATEPTAAVGHFGWDYGESLAAGNELYYSLQLDAAVTAASFLLSWNAVIPETGGVPDLNTLELSDLDLLLFDSSGSFLQSLVGESASAVDNVEHLYFPELDAGTYTLAVRNDAGGFETDFGLAWRVTAVPEPSSLVLLSAVAGLGLRRRRLSFLGSETLHTRCRRPVAD